MAYIVVFLVHALSDKKNSLHVCPNPGGCDGVVIFSRIKSRFGNVERERSNVTSTLQKKRGGSCAMVASLVTINRAVASSPVRTSYLRRVEGVQRIALVEARF